MRHITTILIIFVIKFEIVAQWNPANADANALIWRPGKVGIGIDTPQKSFDVFTGYNDYVSFGATLSIGQFSGIHFGYLEKNNTLYRKAAIVFERLDGSARGKIHFLNNGGWDSNSATLADSKLTIDYSGRVGIGVVSPEGKLHVNGVAYFGNENGNSRHRVAIGGSDGNYGSIGHGYLYTTTNFQHMYAVNDYASQLGFDEGGFTFRAAPYGTTGSMVNFTDVVKILRDGRVGFGTSTPAEVIHVNGNGRVNARIGRWASFGETHSGLATIIGTNVKASNDAVHRMEFIESTVDGGKAIKMQYDEGISFHTYLGNVTSGAEFNGYERMRIDNYGRVGIGTTSPDATLTVKGSIHTQEVKVDLLGAVAPDYVFEPTYELKSLSEVESYIKEHKHLPEVPSAKEMEEQGLHLKEMNMLLLKKVEELTLYVIDLKKENHEQDQQNKFLKEQIELLIKKIDEKK